MKIFSFIGSSNSGKTTIIEYIINELHEKYKILYFKNIPHNDFSMDSNTKDTWKMEKAGAFKIYGLTPDKTYSFENSPHDINDLVKNSSEDIIIAEGFKKLKNAVKFVVIGDKKYLENEYNYIITTKNEQYNNSIRFPEEKNKIIDIIENKLKI